MYLTDSELSARLSALDFTSDDRIDFDPAEQIGPCSIDLRWSSVYWVTTKRSVFPPSVGRESTLDLGKTALREYDTTRGWRRVELRAGDALTLKPGETILARTAEKFTIPPDCAGAIDGRSSVARLGISIHANAGFINPGWRGRMPLTITNHSDRAIKLPVGVAICQLMLVKLRQLPERSYADRGGEAKYMDDYGGPSLWWRDRFFKRIVNSGGPTIGERVFDDLDQLFSNDNPEFEVLERLEAFISKQRGEIDSCDALLTTFAQSETKKKNASRTTLLTLRGAFPVLAVGLLYPLVFEIESLLFRIILGIVILGCVGISIWAITLRLGGYLTDQRLQRARHTTARRVLDGDRQAERL